MDLSIVMDDNARDVLVSAIQVGGGFAGGLVVAVLANRWNTKREGTERAHADAVRREERWMRDRREVAAQLIAAVQQTRSQVFAYPNDRDGGFKQVADVLRLRWEVRLIAVDLDQLAGSLVEALTAYVDAIEKRKPEPEPELRNSAVSSALKAFIDAAAKGLSA